MGKNIFAMLIFTFGFIFMTFSQEVIHLNQTKGKIEYNLNQNQIKILANDVDLETIKIMKNDESSIIKPAILLPTSHAKEYAIIDFSACPNGTYFFEGLNGEEKIYFTITLLKK